MFDEIISFIKSLYPDEKPVPLHAPRFTGNEKIYLTDCIDSTYVSYIGQYVSRFENHIQTFTGAKYAVAVDSGTAALHIALLLAGVSSDDEVITQALGSFYYGRHAGLFGDIGILSFNGNKPVTTGGGGMIITDNEDIAKKAKHLTTTAKQPHPWEFNHDCVGYNYRMPNINAAVGCAQMEGFYHVLENKRQTARMYHDFFQNLDVSFVLEPENAQSNYWLNAIVLKDRQKRDQFLEFGNQYGVQVRPVWTLMNHLPMYRNCQTTAIDNAQWLEDRLVNIPSSVRI